MHHRCQARLQHLADIGEPIEDHAVAWNSQRIDRLLVEHLLRSACQESAFELAKESDIEVLNFQLWHTMGFSCRY